MNGIGGKTALITGGGRGIGRAISLALAAAGADIVINYSGNGAAADEVKTLAENLGVKAMTFRADVSDYAQCEAMFSAAEETFGAPDILINNAGITKDGLLMRMPPEDFEQVIGVNLKGAFYCIKLASRPMIKKRAGRIVNITSIVGMTGNAGQANYASSKAGLIGLTKTAAKELAPRGITVNAVAPGLIETEMTGRLPEELKASMRAAIPLGRAGTPEEVARAVLFLAGESAGYITGQVLPVDGGMAM